MSLPPITVIIPCYRCAATLGRAVESVLAGAPANLQLLLVDDGSPDATPALCDELAARDPRVTALHRENGGASAARNTGLDAAKGDWVLFLDADDELLPGLWQALPEALAQDPAMVLFGMERASGPAPCPLSPGVYPALKDTGAALEPLLFESGYLAAPYSKVFSAAALGSLRFDEALAVNEDVLFNLEFQLFSQIKPAICCLAGVYYKQNDLEEGSLSRRLRGDLLDAEARTRPVLERLLRAQHLPEEEIARLCRKSKVRAALNQYGLLTGRDGALPCTARRALFARILADPECRAALQAELRRDPHPLLALPYRLGTALGLPGLLAGYTAVKNRILYRAKV